MPKINHDTAVLFWHSTLPPALIVWRLGSHGGALPTQQFADSWVPGQNLTSPETWHAPRLQALLKSHALLLQDYGRVKRIAGSVRASVPLTVTGPLPSSQPSVGSRNPSPLPYPLTLPQLCMLFQSTQEESQGAEASAEPGERTTHSSLQRTLTAQIMGVWAKHDGALGALDHIGLR